MSRFDFSTLYQWMEGASLAPWAAQLPSQLADILSPEHNGHYLQWCAVLDQLPALIPSSLDFNSAAIRIGDASELDQNTRAQVENGLRAFMPWRKGPYQVFGTYIDTEWRSDLKWERILPHITPLKGRRILDVGCGSGYHCWRMLGEDAAFVLGIDPSLLFFFQFQVINHFARRDNIHLLPLPLEAVPAKSQAFDTVFSMGVLYHRRSPLDHIAALHDCLLPGGELVLETLVIEGGLGHSLMPQDRYAMMRNVWFIPTCDTLSLWLARCGFKEIRVVDVSRTTVEEQRATDWMRFQSLSDFLDPANLELTVEGYPAPRRAVLIAKKS